MGKYQRSIIWIIITIILSITTVFLTMIFRNQRWVAIFLIAAIIMFILFFPILIIDVKKSSEDKIIKKEEAKKLELKRAELELEKEKLELEKLKLQQGIIEDSGNYCTFCGSSIVGNPKICPKCGSPLTE